MKKNSHKILSILLYTLSFILIVYCAFWFRNIEYHKTARYITGILPFSTDTVCNLSITKNFTSGKTNTVLNNPVFMEYIFAKAACFFNCSNNINELQNIIRLLLRLFASLTAGLLFVLLISSNISFIFAFFGSLLFSVSQAAVYGSGSLSFSNDLLALPIILMVYLFYTLYKKNKRFINLIFAGFFIFLSLAVSQTAQLNLYLLVIYLITAYYVNNKEQYLTFKVILVLFIFSIASSLLIPYLQNIHFITSPLIIVLFPFALIFTGLNSKLNKNKKLVLAGSFLILLLIVWLIFFLNGKYIKNYALLLKLFISKIYFWNIKPLNPENLTFPIRILWNNSFRSAGFEWHWKLFHFTFYFLLIIIFVTFLNKKFKKKLLKNIDSYSLFFFMAAFYFILFLFFIKFSLYAILFISISIAIVCNNINTVTYSKMNKSITIILLPLLILTESAWSFRTNNEKLYYYKISSDLINYFRKNNFSDRNILCDYSISPLLSVYCNLKPVLQLSSQNRKEDFIKIKDFYRIMYLGNEHQLYKFCAENKVEFLLFSKDMAFGKNKTEKLNPYSLECNGSANKLNKNSFVFKFNKNPLNFDYFYLLDQQFPYSISEQFSIFKFISKENMLNADKLTDKAQFMFDSGNIQKAAELINTSIKMYPNSPQARFLCYLIYNKWPFITLNDVKVQNISH